MEERGDEVGNGAREAGDGEALSSALCLSTVAGEKRWVVITRTPPLSGCVILFSICSRIGQLVSCDPLNVVVS